MKMICTLCPRKCSAVREDTRGSGFCGMGALPTLALASVHRGEEPCISGTAGSGTVFFSGCSLRCSFCQNRPISLERFGMPVSVDRLREIYGELIAKGVHNINLVNPTHFAAAIEASLSEPLPVPVVWNTGGYERVETLQKFENKVSVYMPDMKYALAEPAGRYSSAADYPEIARAAIGEMVRQTGPYELDADGLLKRGVLIRHLVLPGQLENTFRVIDWVAETFAPGEVLFSLMSQFTPYAGDCHPELHRRLTQEEHGAAVDYLMDSGIEDGFYQDLESADTEYIPNFDLSGVTR